MLLARALLVGATLGSDMQPHFKLTPRHFRQSSSSPTQMQEEEEHRPLTPGAAALGRVPSSAATSMTELGGEGCFYEDHPRMRAMIRRVCGFSTLVFWAAVIMGIVAGIDYQKAIDSGAHAALVRHLWCVDLHEHGVGKADDLPAGSNIRVASTAVTLVLLVGLIFGVLYASYVVPRVPREGVFWLVTIATLVVRGARLSSTTLPYGLTS